MKKDLIDEIAKNEETVRALYKDFAKEFDSYKDFWLSLAEDEAGHADMLRKLNSELDDSKIMIENERFSENAIMTFRENVLEQIQNLKDNEVTIVEALASAQINERALIENNCFDVFETDSVKLKDTFNKLQEESRKHLGLVEEALKDAKRKEE